MTHPPRCSLRGATERHSGKAEPFCAFGLRLDSSKAEGRRYEMENLRPGASPPQTRVHRPFSMRREGNLEQTSVEPFGATDPLLLSTRALSSSADRPLRQTEHIMRAVAF